MSQKWIRSYERHKMKIKTERELNESWALSRYNVGSWQDSQKIFIKSLGLTIGQSWWKIRRLWRKYKMLGRKGEYRDDVAYQINRLAVGLDLGRVDLPEIADLPDSEFEAEVSDQEQDEEVDGEQEPEQDLSFDEIQQLKREEAEAQAEADAQADIEWKEADELPSPDDLPW